MLESAVYICDFHRLQAWQRWLNTSSHGLVQGKEEVLALLKKLAKAPTETAYETALQSLRKVNTGRPTVISETGLKKCGFVRTR